MIKFSIIVPVYNAEDYIERCVRSIMNQNFRNLEIILVNDGSKDRSEIICKRLTNEDQRILYVAQENQGPSIARQAGLSLATGDYISFVDADDSLEDGLFEEIVPLCEQGFDIVEFGYYTVWDANREKHKLQCVQHEGLNCLSHYINQKNVTNYLCNKVFKKSLFSIVEFPMIYMSEDQCILTQLYYYANAIYTVENAYYNYFSNPTSLCNSPFSRRTLDVLKANEYIYNFLKEKQVDFAAVQSIMGVNSAILVYNKLELTYHGDDIEYYKKLIKDDYHKWLHICVENKVYKLLSFKQKLKWMLFKMSPKFTSILRKRIRTRSG